MLRITKKKKYECIHFELRESLKYFTESKKFIELYISIKS